MICPVCGGTGKEVSRLLGLFTWRRSCPNCAGEGHVGDLNAKKAPPFQSGDDDRRRDSFSDRTVDSFSPSGSNRAHQPEDPLSAVGGGRSGGGGAGASWSDEAGTRVAASQDERDSPVIVDPFLADESPSSDARDLGSDDISSGSDDRDSDSDSGTSY